MRSIFSAVMLWAVLMISGCSVLPTNPVPLSEGAVGPSAGRVGVAMSEVPAVDTFLPGADCLLCMAVAAGANSELTDHARTLPPEGVAELKQRVAELLEARGTEVVQINVPFDLSKLPSFRGGETPNVAKKDFRQFKDKYAIEKLLVIDIAGLGFKRTYSAYVPTSDPKGWLGGYGYLVDLNTNTYDWYLPVDVQKSAEGEWDEPKDFPGLTNAYFQALEHGKDAFLAPFAAEPPAPAIAAPVAPTSLDEVASQ